MTNKQIKQELYNYCQAFFEERLKTIRQVIFEIETSLQSESKSSAGDKHETGRAMLHLEREKAGQKLAELDKTRNLLSKIDINKRCDVIGLGSLVYTLQANYFISISAGKLEVENLNFYAISPSTPIGQLLLGKTKGDQVSFRKDLIKIDEVY